MTTEKTIVVKRTFIERYFNEDGTPDLTRLQLLVYIPGEHGVSCDYKEDTWEYNWKDKEWDNTTLYYTTDGIPEGLFYHMGSLGQACVESILNALLEKEVVTAGIVTTVTLSEGHELPICSRCKHWKDGYCSIVNQSVAGDSIIPCSLLFTPNL